MPREALADCFSLITLVILINLSIASRNPGSVELISRMSSLHRFSSCWDSSTQSDRGTSQGGVINSTLMTPWLCGAVDRLPAKRVAEVVHQVLVVRYAIDDCVVVRDCFRLNTFADEIYAVAVTDPYLALGIR